MSKPEFNPDMNAYNTLLRQEEDVKTRLIQRVTLDYMEARRLDSPEKPYLQGMEVEVPVPAIAYRKDSKRTFLSTDSGIDRDRLYVYVPAEEESSEGEPDRWFTKAWVKVIDHGGVESMFQIDESGFSVYETPSDQVEREVEEIMQEADIPEAEVSVLEVELETLVNNALAEQMRQKRASIRKMREITDSLKRDFELVPFDS